jgi:hypothetical protein
MKLALDCWYELWKEAGSGNLNSRWLPGTGVSSEETIVLRRPNEIVSWQTASTVRPYEKPGGGRLPRADAPLSHVR